jgi:hypothetical protein
MRKGLFLLAFVLLAFCVYAYAENHIIYVAHQDWLSRVYIMRMNGTVVNYYEYSYYYFCDIETANGEIHLAEAFAPESFRFDPYTGSITPVINDISLFYFYDLAFDGTYFYVTEWDLNRYDINGNKDGTASFDEDVMGGAWNGLYYWTLNDTNEIQCWDLSSWPTLTEVPSNNFAPPTSACRGLWFDGQYFWTAESFDGYLGNIYQFDYSGSIIDQWSEPAYRGWAACVVDLVGVEESEEDNRELRTGKWELTCSPNPFTAGTSIKVLGTRNGEICTLRIFDVSGRVVRNFRLATSNSQLATEVSWDGRDEGGERVPPGVYLLKLEIEGCSVSRKVLLIK